MSLDNYSFTDSNGDGLGDVGAADFNGDGAMDAYALDSNFDGYVDTYQNDLNGDGYFESLAYDSTQDGYPETVQCDTNLDGFIDTAGIDSDGNGLLETMLTDRDGDGIQEAGVYYDQYGQVAGYTTPETGTVPLQPVRDLIIGGTQVGGTTQGGILDPLFNSPVIMNDPRAVEAITDIIDSQHFTNMIWAAPDNVDIVRRDY